MDGLVYSCEQGRICPGCGNPIASCSCKKAKEEAAKGSGRVRVGRQTKGRKGAGVTVITGLPLAGAELKTLAKELKGRCGSGGTVKDGVVEIQGDHRDLLVKVLLEKGYEAKRSGG